MGDYETYGPYEVFKRNYDTTNKGELVPFYLNGEYIGDVCKISINHQLIDCIKAFELDSLGEFIRRHKSLNDDTRSFIADIIDVKKRAKLSRALGKRALKSFHPRLFNARFFAGESWSVSNGRYCRN